MNGQDDLRQSYPINRRTFVTMAAAGAASTLFQGNAAAQPAPKARNVLLVPGLVWSDDEGRLSEEAFLRDFAGDLPADKARVLYAVQEPFKRRLLGDKTTHAAWRSKPSWYAVSTDDRTINPDLERFMAKRTGEGQSPFPDIATRHDHKSDPRGGRRRACAN